ncbi:hypothetical protein SARC_10779 [Sphaeroforma arctica JP610]|uniref:Uncharacterized protein n=1 Tax=Sphaeroforma arctica JP610 TaxID=667725 RepID=A0A0L0FIX8_9EUKA|nr:hypothetical protein SARC_10779 [Sphaeroforma arctica JP610]KNC76737.1 hypothetical protein SARC_10779 [Sphaeroforma arctica JP610]|eukprot:XP_014150639.1 hypothetical protein SARC_10779 [Sphaeroforma arctica JP610]
MVLSILIVVVYSDLLYNYLHQSKTNGNGFYKSFAYFVIVYMYLVAYSEHFVVIAFLAMEGISLRTELSPTNTLHFDDNCIGNYVSRGGSLVILSLSTLMSTQSIVLSKRKDMLNMILPACAEFIANSEERGACSESIANIEESGQMSEDISSSTKCRTPQRRVACRHQPINAIVLKWFQL